MKFIKIQRIKNDYKLLQTTKKLRDRMVGMCRSDYRCTATLSV